MAATAPPKNIARELRNHCDVPGDVLEKARWIYTEAERGVVLGAAVLAAELLGMCKEVIYTTYPGVDTWAVTLGGDGLLRLLVNPNFAVKLGVEGSHTVLLHECGHAMLQHVHVDERLRADPAWKLACEICINHMVIEDYGRSLPTVDGAESGVNPREMYRKYREDLKKNGKEPVSYEEFVKTDLGCFAQLKRMTKPPAPKGQLCVHMQPGSGDGQAGQGSPVQLDQAELERVVGEAIDNVMHDAVVNGRREAKEDLLRHAERVSDSERGSKMWGDRGIGALRGETVATRKVDYWQQWVVDKVRSKLEEGLRLRYNRKWPWDPQLAYRGKDRISRGVVACDTSGSMYQAVLDRLAELVGQTPGLEVTWLAFDGEAHPFKPGEPFRGGGGTNFQCIEDYVTRLEDEGEEIDFVLPVTDGFAPHITPHDHDKWVWLITENGDDWPSRHTPAMDCRKLELPAR